MVAGRFLVFFRAGVCNLATAARSLADYGLTVSEEGDSIVPGRPGAPQFTIHMWEGDDVHADAADIGRGTALEEVMWTVPAVSMCRSRIWTRH